jgi:hypothetical protein
MPRPSTGSFLQKHEYKNCTCYKTGKAFSLQYVKNIYRFVYALHRIDKRGKANNI